MEAAEKCQILQNQVFCVGDVEYILQGLELRPPCRLHFKTLGEPQNHLWRWKVFLYPVNYSSSISLLICALIIASTKKVPKATLRTSKFIILYFSSGKQWLKIPICQTVEFEFLMCSLCFSSQNNWAKSSKRLNMGNCNIYKIKLIPLSYLNFLLSPHTSDLWDSLLSCEAMKICRKTRIVSLTWFNTSVILKSYFCSSV